MPGVVMSPEFAQQVQRVVKQVLRSERSQQAHQGRWQDGSDRRWAIANADIAAPSNGVTTPTTGTIELLDVDSSGNLIRTGQTETLTHRWEGVSIDDDMLLRVDYQHGEWFAYGVDCAALGSPPA